ncbi:hypothetical protein TSUD_105730 [Trifolium subterraneum]|uniref:CCHC-type domain-containing protein n=1 Tax=Trifolium subterraneum TaxID=3900 RepID=A0A2Z6M581_TRISU|nr:hypothetical protein TSUD_105730 [Trifolium subterraneum]
MKGKMAEFWHPICGVAVKQAGTNLSVFIFFHPRDLERVLKKGPWSFDGHTLILGLLQQGQTPTSVALNHVPFWVQIHDVPVGGMTTTAGKQSGNFIGEFMEYDEKNNSNFLSTFMRIRVLVDIRKPLKRFKKIKTKVGSHEVKLKYERLGSICYYCGILGHNEDSCKSLFESPNDDGVRMWNADLLVTVNKNHISGSSSRWLREDSAPTKAPAMAEGKASVVVADNKTVTEYSNKEHSSSALITNNSGKHISLVEAFSNLTVLFPLKSIITNKKENHMIISEEESMEEELDTTIKKRIRGSHTIAINEEEKGEIDNTLKKIIHNIQEPMMGASNGKTNVEVTHEHPSNKKVHVLKTRHDPLDYAHSDDVPFLRVVPGTQVSREK